MNSHSLHIPLHLCLYTSYVDFYNSNFTAGWYSHGKWILWPVVDVWAPRGVASNTNSFDRNTRWPDLWTRASTAESETIVYSHVEIAEPTVKMVGGNTREQFTAIKRMFCFDVVLKVMLHVWASCGLDSLPPSVTHRLLVKKHIVVNQLDIAPLRDAHASCFKQCKHCP